ncbi:MAG: TolC family protein [Novosphingobium sp.]|jgi:adhesin transport system outer membrane protein|nr:TolC family protein [Novosphingobium sp.]
MTRFCGPHGPFPVAACLLLAALLPGGAAAQSQAGAPARSGEAIPVYPGILPPQTAVALAIARRPEIRGAEAVIAQRQAEVALARAGRWPTIQYGIGPGYGASYGGGRNAAALRGNAGIDMPVWDFGGMKNRIAAARGLEQAAREDRLATAEQVARVTLAAYVDAQTAQERVAAAEATIAAMRGVADRIGQRARAGLSDRSDVNAADIAVARAGIEAQQARTLAGTAMGRLIQLVGVSPGGLAPLAGSYALTERRDRSEPDFDQAPRIKAAERQFEAASAKVAAARAAQWPAIGIGASRTFSTGAASANDSTWFGLTVRGDFSLGGTARHKVGAARAEREAAMQELGARRLEARTDWQVAESEEQGARRRLGDLADLGSLWRATRDLYWQEYILDKRSLSDVIGAEREIHAARAEEIAAMGEAVDAGIRALVAQGGLVALLEQEPPAAISMPEGTSR